MHFLHLSTARSAALVAAAKAEGLAVTAEVTPHHLTLTHAELAGYDPVFKVNPPLRTDADVAALRAACADGTVDAIATDHAPHAPERKDDTLDVAPPGMLGLQTALPVVLGALCGRGRAGATVTVAGAAPTPRRPRPCRRVPCSACCRGARPASPGSLGTREATREGPSSPVRPPTSA